MGRRGLFGGGRNVPKLDLVVVAQLCTLTKNHLIVHLKRGKLTLTYNNKAVFKKLSEQHLGGSVN